METDKKVVLFIAGATIVLAAISLKYLGVVACFVVIGWAIKALMER